MSLNGAIISDERQLEDDLIGKLRELKYEYRADIRDRAAHGSGSQLNVTGWTVSSPASH